MVLAHELAEIDQEIEEIERLKDYIDRPCGSAELIMYPHPVTGLRKGHVLSATAMKNMIDARLRELKARLTAIKADIEWATPLEDAEFPA